MESQHVRYFLAVVDHGTINAAAYSLGVAQPTISQAMRALERELRTPLFYRIGRGMVPTSAGHALIRPARRLLRDLASAAASIPDSDGHLRGRVDIHAHPGVSSGLLPRIIAEFHRRYPLVQVVLGSMETDAKAVGLIQDSVCEIVLAYLPLRYDADEATRAEARPLTTVELGTLHYAAAFPPGRVYQSDGAGYDGAGDDGAGDGVAPAMIPGTRTMRWEEVDERTVVVPQGTEHTIQIHQACSPAQQARRPAVVVQSREARLAFALAGLGVTWVDHSMIGAALERGGQVFVMVPPLPKPFGLAYDAEALSPAAQAFVDVALEVAVVPPASDDVAASPPRKAVAAGES